MRHRRAGRKFNRDTKSRKALMRSLATALIREGRVVTTEAKGKALRSLADRLVTVARGSDDLQARRQLQLFFGKRDVANVLVDRIVPINTDRESGLTTLSTFGNRAGDNAHLVEVKWMTMPELVGTLRNPKPAAKNERKARRAPAVKSEKTVAVKVAANSKVAVVKPAIQKKTAKKLTTKTEKKTVVKKVATPAKSTAKKTATK